MNRVPDEGVPRGDDVKHLLGRAVDDEPALGIDRSAVIADGRRRLRARRGAAVGGVAVAAAALVLGVNALSGLSYSSPDPVGPASGRGSLSAAPTAAVPAEDSADPDLPTPTSQPVTTATSPPPTRVEVLIAKGITEGTPWGSADTVTFSFALREVALSLPDGSPQQVPGDPDAWYSIDTQGTLAPSGTFRVEIRQDGDLRAYRYIKVELGAPGTLTNFRCDSAQCDHWESDGTAYVVVGSDRTGLPGETYVGLRPDGLVAQVTDYCLPPTDGAYAVTPCADEPVVTPEVAERIISAQL